MRHAKFGVAMLLVIICVVGAAGCERALSDGVTIGITQGFSNGISELIASILALIGDTILPAQG